jgi:5-methylcytosine-specific restriction endonuclease McrA
MLEILVCSVCGEEKETSNYKKNKCKYCYNEYMRKVNKKSRDKNLERTRMLSNERNKRRRERNPELCKLQGRRNRRNSYYRNKDKKINNLENQNGYVIITKKDHEHFLLSLKVRRAFGSGTEEVIQIWKDMCDFYENKCLCCKSLGDYSSLEPDHILPKCKGGEKSIDNIQPLCGVCNNKKHMKHIDYRTKIFVPANIPT